MPAIGGNLLRGLLLLPFLPFSATAAAFAFPRRSRMFGMGGGLGGRAGRRSGCAAVGLGGRAGREGFLVASDARAFMRYHL